MAATPASVTLSQRARLHLHKRAARQRQQLAHQSGFHARGRVCLERTCFTVVAMAATVLAPAVVPGLAARDASAETQSESRNLSLT